MSDWTPLRKEAGHVREAVPTKRDRLYAAASRWPLVSLALMGRFSYSIPPPTPHHRRHTTTTQAPPSREAAVLVSPLCPEWFLGDEFLVIQEAINRDGHDAVITRVDITVTCRVPQVFTPGRRFRNLFLCHELFARPLASSFQWCASPNSLHILSFPHPVTCDLPSTPPALKRARWFCPSP